MATFDPSKIPALIADLQALVAAFPSLAQAVADLISLFKTPVAKATMSVRCGPSGETDACCCCDAMIEQAVCMLATAIQCKHCCEANP